MNKLLQHIIDAGDVDHKVLPGLQKMQKGGYQEELPKAQWGSFVNPVTIAGAATLFAKAKEFFGFNEPKIVRTPASAPKRLSIRDPRKIMMTTGKPLRPNSDLVSGEYDSEDLGNLLTEAKRRKMSYNDMMNLAAMGFQETKWGKTDPNIGHTQDIFGDDPNPDAYENFINAYNAKMKDADRLKIKDEATRLQVYNGLGKVFPSTEADYHGFKMKKIYGVEVPKGGIDLRKNPLYGKQVMDIRDNVLKRNPEFMRYMDSTYRAPMPKEEEFANGGLFKVFAQEGLEYKGPSIVDYLATKGYSGNKTFRKGLAEKYGIEGYDYSAAKNTELLNRLRENDDLLEQNYQPTQAAIPVERMMEMESQARAARKAAAQSVPPPSAQRPVNPGNYYTYSPDYGDMRIPQPKINTSLQPKVKYDKFSLSPQMVIPLPFGFGKQTPSEIPNSEITDPVRNVPARPKLNLPQYNPFVKPVAKPELGPFNSERYDNVQEVDPVNQETDPEFLFNSEKLFNSFNRPKQKPLLPVVIPAKKPVVKTEKYTKPEVEELPWYEEAANAVTNTLKGFYDDFAESVEKSPLDFRGMNFGSTGISPQGATEMTRDLTKRGLSLFSPDMAEKYDNWLNRQQAIKNMDKDPVSKIVVPDFDYAPMYITGDTIPDGNRQYHIPESMDLNALRFGSRNRGDLTPIDTEAGSITAFHPFIDSKSYFTETPNDPANSTYLGITPDGQIQVGGRKDFENKDVKISRVFSNKVVDFVRESSGSIKKVAAGDKVSKNAFSPAVTVIGDDGKQKEGKLNLVLPQGDKADEAFGVATGGRFIFKTPDGQTRLVSGSLKNIEEEFKRIKGKNPYVTVVSLDNGSYSRGLRTKDQKFTAADLRAYDNLNTGGGNFAYLLPGQQTSRPLAKFAEFEKEATKKLQALYPGKKVSVGYQNTGLYDQTGGRDIQSQVEIQKKGNSQTPVSLHNFGAAKDYILYVDGKPINADKDKKIYKDVLWSAADKTGMYHLEDWDPAHISLAKEGQKTAFDELKSKYPEIFTDPNFVKSLEFINKNKSNPTYQEYYELLNNIQPFTGQPRITEFEKRKGITKKAYGGPILDPRGQWAHPGKVTRIPGSDITMQGVNYPVLGIGNNGKKQMMYPGQEYNFGGASYVDEYPMMQKGGWSGGGLSRSDLATMAALNKNVNKKKYAHDHDTRITVEDGSLKEGYKDMRNFMQYWLTERAQDPKFTEWANRRLSVLDNLSGKYKTYTNKDIETNEDLYNSQAYYTPKDSSLNFNTDYPTSFSAPTQIHELTHKMDYEDNTFYNQPRWFWDANLYSTPSSFISKQVIPKNKNFKTDRYVSTKNEYDYLSTPTEINARLNEFRYQYNLDPKKKYTAEDMKKIINDHNNYKGSFKNLRDELFKSRENSLNSLDDILKIIGNDPQKLADLHNNVVKNKTSYASDAMPQVKNGGIVKMQIGGFKPPFGNLDLKKRWENGQYVPPLTSAATTERQFLTDWNNSAMGKKMLYDSVDKDDPSGINYLYADKIRDDRNALIKQASVNLYDKKDFSKKVASVFSDRKDVSGIAGYATLKNPLTGKRTVNSVNDWNAALSKPGRNYIGFTMLQPNKNYEIHMHNEDEGDGGNQTLVHELGHASDASGFLMPDSDLQKIKRYSYGNDGKRQLSKFQKYVADPTETRARLLNFRYNAKNQGLYNPFNQKATGDVLKKYEDYLMDGYDPLEQLREVYDDKQILDMLNTISQSKKQASDIIPYAKNGGYTVTRSNDRKGKTHKVTGPGGVVKYFGDSKLGQHPKDPERKKAFYARHKKNLDGNPFFRAFARKTWQGGGPVDSTLENIFEIIDPTGMSSWDDVYKSYKETGRSPQTDLEIFGAIPLLGKIGKFGKALKIANPSKAATKGVASTMLQSIPYVGRGTDAIQAIQQAPNVPFFPSAPPPEVGQFGVYAGMQNYKKQDGGLWNTDKVAYLDSTINANRNLEFIRRAVENDGLSIPTPKGAPGYGKGMTSSHLMTYDPKSRRSYPELVNINGTLKYLTGDDAYNYAEDTGEYIQFPTAEQANYFSQNYKKSNYVKVGKQPLEKKHGIKVTYKK